MFRILAAMALLWAQSLAMHVEPVTLEGGGSHQGSRLEMEIVASEMAECKRLNGSTGFRPWNHDMDKLRESKMWAWITPRRDPPQPRTEEVKMAFLVFANDRMENEDIWLHWMEQAQKADLDFSLHIHSRALAENKTWESDRFKDHVVADNAKTKWCKLWEAQMNMIHRVLVDPHVSHLVILSSDSVPVKPMAWMYEQAHNEPLSRFCVDDYWRDPWPRAEAWSVLRRDDAMFFDENRDFASKNFRRGCEDQLAWYFPLRVRWDNFHQKAALKRECIMFANWKDGQSVCQGAWAKSVDSCDCKNLRRGNMNHTAADYHAPVAYHEVNKDMLEDLVRSPFWFARKFTEGAVPQKLKSVLDTDLSKSRKRFKLFR